MHIDLWPLATGWLWGQVLHHIYNLRNMEHVVLYVITCNRVCTCVQLHNMLCSVQSKNETITERESERERKRGRWRVREVDGEGEGERGGC